MTALPLSGAPKSIRKRSGKRMNSCQVWVARRLSLRYISVVWVKVRVWYHLPVNRSCIFLTMSRPEGGRGDDDAGSGRRGDDFPAACPGCRAADRRKMRNILLILGN